MKKIFQFFVLILASVALCSCAKFEDEDYSAPDNGGGTAYTATRACLRSAAGYSSEVIDTVYIQENIQTALKVEPKVNTDTIVSASWTIAGANFTGTQVVYKATTLGPIAVSVTVTFKDGKTEEDIFKVKSVLDISSVDPVKMFSTKNSDGSWTILALFSKERVRLSSSTSYAITGSCVDWKAQSAETSAYIIDANGNPKTTADVGKYVGAKFSLKETGSYNLALVYNNGWWADFSGSAFVDITKNPGSVVFAFDAVTGQTSPSGTVAAKIPGVNGDDYFRFDIGKDSTDLYFKVDTVANKAFCMREATGGYYSAPISLKDSGFSGWGKIRIKTTGEVDSFRFGRDISKPDNLSSYMPKSIFYDDYFKALRILVVRL